MVLQLCGWSSKFSYPSYIAASSHSDCNFDLKVDAIRAALNAMGFKDIEIVVAETGWPYKGDPNEVGPSVENARAYNGNLINHLRSMVGTPLMPGKSVDTYIFALYDENLKPGPSSERAFGLYNSDLSMTYDVGLSKSSQVRRFPSFSIARVQIFLLLIVVAGLGFMCPVTVRLT